MLSYSHQEFAYDGSDEEASEYRLDRKKKDYSRVRSNRALRKRSRQRANAVGCGIAERRNKRMGW